MSLYNSIEEELWRIFTYYALHADPSQPEAWRVASFIKFSKDCQIIVNRSKSSSKLTATSIELEITKMVYF